VRLPSLRVARGPRHLPRHARDPSLAPKICAPVRIFPRFAGHSRGPELATQPVPAPRHAMPASRRLALLGQHLGRTTEEPRASGPLTAVPTGLLKGIDPLLTAELLYVLRMAGHGDVISIVDCNFPAAEVASKTFYGKVFGTRAASGPLSLLSGWQAGPSAIAVCHFPCVVCAMRSRSCSLA
jgi:hypothetical protein